MADLAHDLAGFETAARERLHWAVWSYLMEGGAAQPNQAAWRRIGLRPRILRGVALVETRTSVLGREVALPVLTAPTGRATRYHPDGEAALLAGVRDAGSLAVLASSVGGSIEPLMAASPKAHAWSQLYVSRDRGHVAGRLQCAEAAGCDAVVLTADLVPGGAPPADLPPLARASWERDEPPGPAPLFAAASLDDLAWVCGQTKLPVVVKGVLRADDAEACIAAGAKGLVVSNHGGNQLKSAIPTAQALPEVVQASAGRAEVYVDGGIRSGEDVLKALAMGARAVLVGRAAAHGLAVGGAAGVTAVIEALRSELVRAMQLCGARTLADMGPDHLG